jgi:uncharacterized phiE125 gp8 family phage protein
MTLSLELITPPAAEPVTLALAKQHLRVDFDDEDTYISALIIAARQYCEKVTRRAFFNQTWVRSLDYFPLYGRIDATRNPSERDSWPYGTWYWDRVTITLPHPRLVSVTSITYLDSNGDEQALPSSGYNIDTISTPGRIAPAQGMFWPILQNYVPGSVKITYVAGSYGDGTEVNTCPQTIVQAMLLLMGHWYQNREAASALTMKTVPMAVDALLSIHRFSVVEYR